MQVDNMGGVAGESMQAKTTTTFGKQAPPKMYLEDAQQLGPPNEDVFGDKQRSCFSKGILEIIKDDDEEKLRTSSNDLMISEEVHRFLRHIHLEFLAEYFQDADHSKTTL